MSLRLSHVTFDSQDPYASAEFWRELLGWKVHKPETYKPGSIECFLAGPAGQFILFYYSPDEKTVKNRGHFDVVPTDGSDQQTEIDRAVGLGAAIVDDRRDDLGWAVLTDPHGNEFCIL